MNPTGHAAPALGYIGAVNDRADERAACRPENLDDEGFNSRADLPYGCTTGHVRTAMVEFLDFLGLVNDLLHSNDLPRLESLLMPANFSSIVGELVAQSIPKHCTELSRNQYHSGHPDLLPRDMYPGYVALHAPEGIELKASRYDRGWQGHNPEDVWLMVFVFRASRATDTSKGITPMPFRFQKVLCARLTRYDWQFSGRSATSRRTITASVARSGYEKMEANRIYRASPD